MRIAIITPRYCDDPTGIAVLGGLEAAYRELGHQARVIGQLRPAARRTQPPPFPVDEFSVGSLPLVGAVRPLTRILGALRGCGFAQLHLIGPLDLGALAAWAACLAAKVPFGATFHDFANPSAPAEPRWRAGLMARMLGQARWVTANSRFVKARIEEAVPRLAGKVSVVGCGLTRGLEERQERPREAGRRTFVLCVARLMPYKGIDLLLLAWKDVCDRFPGIDLVICGPDDSRGHYQLLARQLGLSSRVAFLGERGRDQVWELLGSCLFAVVPSRHEAFGLSIIEAMSCGKAVLATRSGGPQEIISDDETGLLVSAGDVGALSRGLRRLLEDEGLRVRLGQAAWQAARRHSWSEAARLYLDLIKGRAQEVPVGRGL